MRITVSSDVIEALGGKERLATMLYDHRKKTRGAFDVDLDLEDLPVLGFTIEQLDAKSKELAATSDARTPMGNPIVGDVEGAGVKL